VSLTRARARECVLLVALVRAPRETGVGNQPRRLRIACLMAIDLTSIENFGGIDADEDALLRECFRDHPAYSAAKAHQRFLVLGRKGSGKTAIFKRLITERETSVFGYGHTFDDYPWHYHDLQAEAGVPEERRYIHSWRYLILMGLAKVLLNVDQSQPWDEAAFEALGDLESFVVDSYGSRDPDLTQLTMARTDPPITVKLPQFVYDKLEYLETELAADGASKTSLVATLIHAASVDAARRAIRKYRVEEVAFRRAKPPGDE
jgi:hypothetical protein